MMDSLPHQSADPGPPCDDGKIRVLLIDDQTRTAAALRAIFVAHAEIEFSHCQDPSGALQVASRIQPTVILQAMDMPEVSGVDLVRNFRAAADLTDVPIVVLSVQEEPATKAEAFLAGADDYLVMLPDEIEIIARVRYHSRACFQQRELRKTLDDLKQAQGRLVQSERMASIGMLAAGVAHEINNPVAFVTANLNSLSGYFDDVFRVIDAYEELQESLPDGFEGLESVCVLKEQLHLTEMRQDIGQILDECKDGVSRVRKIVEDMRGFSRSDVGQLQRVDLHDEMDRALNIATNEIKYKADVEKNYGDLPMVECIPSQISQVFLNLLVNAAQAIEGRGYIRINTSTGTLPEDLVGKEMDSSVNVDPKLWACVRISDTGSGIDEISLRRIFDPFFTTKETCRGTGLGLALSYGIVQRHGGYLEVESEPGTGTTFSVWLPGQRGRKMAA